MINMESVLIEQRRWFTTNYVWCDLEFVIKFYLIMHCKLLVYVGIAGIIVGICVILEWHLQNLKFCKCYLVWEGI